MSTFRRRFALTNWREIPDVNVTFPLPVKNGQSKRNNQVSQLHVINGLGRGGTEGVLAQILKLSSQGAGVSGNVVLLSLGAGREMLPEISENAIELIEADIRRRPLRAARDIWTALGQSKVVCSWSYHTHVMSAVLGLLRGRRQRLVWFVRHSDTSLESSGWRTYLVIRMCALFSPLADKISYNGVTARRNHERIGFSASDTEVSENGCDLERFKPCSISDRLETQHRIVGKAVECPVILSAARWHPIKDHASFIRCLGVLRRKNVNFIAWMCGREVDHSNVKLMELLAENDLRLNVDVYLLGERSDLEVVMSAADVFVLHSRSEAFPNTLLQAMASGSRIVATNVGDSERILGGAVKPVRPGCSEALAERLQEELTQALPQVDEFGRNLREIVESEYSLNEMLDHYQKVILGEEYAR